MKSIIVSGDYHIGHNGDGGFHRTTYVGSSNVFINSKRVVIVDDLTTCGDRAVEGSSTIFINNKPVHRTGDATSGHDSYHANEADQGSEAVFGDD